MAKIIAQQTKATDCDIAILAEGDGAYIDATGADVSRSRIGMMATDHGLLGGLGFPAGTDHTLIAELLTTLAQMPAASRPIAAKESSLIRSIAATTSDVNAILANILSALNSPLIMGAAKQLGF